MVKIVSEYKRIENDCTPQQFEKYLNKQNIFIQKNSEGNLLSKSIELLKMWGRSEERRVG